MKGRKKLNR